MCYLMQDSLQKKKLKALVFVRDSIVPQTETIKTANGKILSVNHGITAMVVRWY